MAETATIYSSASDGYFANYSYVSYNDVWAATTRAPTTSTTLLVGQAMVVTPPWYVYRSAVFFDTSGIPSTATITTALLRFYGHTNGSTQDFNITVQNGMPYYPHDPLEAGDYNKANYSGDGGSVSTAGFTTTGYNTITLNSTGREWINKGGQTKFFLRSDRDITGAAPSTPEYVRFYASEEAGKQPYLYIEYELDAAEDTGATYPGLGSNEDRDGKDSWASPTNIQAEANAAVWSALDDYGDWLRASNFGFSIPLYSAIVGIKVEIHRHCSSNYANDSSLRLVDSDGVSRGDDKASASYWPIGSVIGDAVTATYGSATDTWGRRWIPAAVNNSNFGVRLSCYATNFSIAYVYWIKVTVYYRPIVTEWVTPAAIFSQTRSGSAIGWTNPSYATASNDSPTTAVVPQSGYTDWLRATQFGLEDHIPGGWEPAGVDVKIERKASIADNLCDSSLRIRKTAGQTGDEGASATKWGTTDEEEIHHISFPVGSLSYDDIISDDFGIDLSVVNDADAITTASVDCISIRVYYIPLEASALTITLQDYYNTGDASRASIGGATWGAQSFTASNTYKITSVKLRLYRSGAPGTITVSIRATDADGKPTGSDLCSGTTNGNTLPIGSPYEWREIALGVGYQLSASIKYAIVVRCTALRTYWRYDYTGEYAGGNYLASSNSGTTWTLYGAYDFMFEVWGQVGSTEPGGKILLETGDALLQEDDFYLLLEYIGGANYFRVINANLSIAAAIARQVAIDRTITSALSLAGAIGRVFGRKRVMDSNLTASATISRKADWKRAISSNITLSALIDITVGAILKYFVTIASNLNLSATIARQLAAKRVTASSLAVSATISAAKGFVRTFTSNLSLSATISRTATYTRNISSDLTLAATIVMTAVGKLLNVVTAMGNVFVIKPIEGGIYAMRTALGNVLSLKSVEGGIYAIKTALGRIYRLIIKE